MVRRMLAHSEPTPAGRKVTRLYSSISSTKSNFPSFFSTLSPPQSPPLLPSPTFFLTFLLSHLRVVHHSAYQRPTPHRAATIWYWNDPVIVVLSVSLPSKRLYQQSQGSTPTLRFSLVLVCSCIRTDWTNERSNLRYSILASIK